jgi:SagB-type dehydrogenase family enzyme
MFCSSKKTVRAAAAALCLLAAPALGHGSEKDDKTVKDQPVITLPKPKFDGGMSLEKAILQRRSVRHFAQTPLALAELSQLLWAAQGITDTEGLRAAPSAGAIYPVETYVAVRNVEGLNPGLYRYIPDKHALEEILIGDICKDLCAACLNQPYVFRCSANIILTGKYEKIAHRYGSRGVRYTHLEIGHISENIYLQAEALGIGTVAIGAFSDSDLKDILRLPEDEDPVYVMPLGKKEKKK